MASRGIIWRLQNTYEKGAYNYVSLMKGMKTDKRRIALEHIKIVAEMEE